jgi:hypothetical protein
MVFLVLYGREIWNERKFQMFQNNALRKIYGLRGLYTLILSEHWNIGGYDGPGI